MPMVKMGDGDPTTSIGFRLAELQNNHDAYKVAVQQRDPSLADDIDATVVAAKRPAVVTAKKHAH